MEPDEHSAGPLDGTFCESDFLPPAWFKRGTTLEQLRRLFPQAKQFIRIAAGFFTTRGWSLIRRFTVGRQVLILVGVAEPGEEQARRALVDEILKDLSLGLEADRRAAVSDLVARMAREELRMVDARAQDHHGKLYIVDREAAVVTSANSTNRGFLTQIESGTLQTDPVAVGRLVDEFDGLFKNAHDITAELLVALTDWLELATPWEIYLRTMLALEDIRPPQRPYKEPVTYQRDMIARTLRQLRDFSGAFLVASTGLGKTVVAVHVALQLHDAREITNVLVIGPKGVRRSWESEMRQAGIPCAYIVQQSLDKEDAERDSGLRDFEDIAASGLGEGWLIILDESHFFRNRMSESNRLRAAFRQLLPITRPGHCKVLLLTGSPFSKGLENLNAQLLLLPHKGPCRELIELEDSRAWRVETAEEFIELSVVSRLTTPHVAKYYGETDVHGLYITFGTERKYLPQVRLTRIDFRLLLEAEMKNLIESRCLKTVGTSFKGQILQEARISWASSPFALDNVLRQVLETPGGKDRYNVVFPMSLERRRKIIEPIRSKLHGLTVDDDPKLISLVQILREQIERRQKVIVFAERRPTAYYLELSIESLLPNVRVFSTIACLQGCYSLKSQSAVEKAIERFAPVANKAVGRYKESFDVFICTDAHGVGINLQDAGVVINYDLDWTAIDPLQRAGRILRPWSEHRTLELITFVPALRADGDQQLHLDLERINSRFDRLLARHDQSQKFTDLPVLPSEPLEDIHLPDVASGYRTTALLDISQQLDILQQTEGEISPFYKHTARLQAHRPQALTLRDDLVSALLKGNRRRVFVLLKTSDGFDWSVYDLESANLVKLTDVQMLSLIACDPEAPVAAVAPEEIEAAADLCIRAWCEHKGISPSLVTRVCTLLLVPTDEGLGAGLLGQP